MVDNRAAGFYGVTGGFDFKGANAQSASLGREKYGQGGEYFMQEDALPEEDAYVSPFMDRSALLRATLNSFAMFNIANILKDKQLMPSKREFGEE